MYTIFKSPFARSGMTLNPTNVASYMYLLKIHTKAIKHTRGFLPKAQLKHAPRLGGVGTDLLRALRHCRRRRRLLSLLLLGAVSLRLGAFVRRL